MTTFTPIHYSYVPTAPRCKRTTHPQITLKKPSILEPSSVALNTHRPSVITAADDDGNGRAKIQEAETIDSGNENENKDDYFPTIGELLYTTLQTNGFAIRDLSLDHILPGVEEIVLDKSDGSTDYSKSASGDHSVDSQDNPVVSGKDRRDERESEVDHDSIRANSAEPDVSLFRDLETASHSSTAVCLASEGRHDAECNDSAKTAQRLRLAEREVSTSNSTLPCSPSSRPSNEPVQSDPEKWVDLEDGFFIEKESQEQQQEKAVEVIAEDGNNHDQGREQQERKRRCQEDREEISNKIQYAEGNDHSHNTSDTDDEDPRPAKRRKLPLVSTNMALTPPREHSPRFRLSRPHSLTPPTATELEIFDVQTQAEQGCPLTLINNAHHHTPPASRSPSTVTESISAAEYQEWPLQGFLKRTIIGNETTYNLQFNLTHILKHLEPSIPSKALGMGSSRKTAARSQISQSAVTHSKIPPPVLEPRMKRAWTSLEDTTLTQMRKNGCSWEEIQAALPNRSKATIQVHYSTKLKGSAPAPRKQRRL